MRAVVHASVAVLAAALSVGCGCGDDAPPLDAGADSPVDAGLDAAHDGGADTGPDADGGPVAPWPGWEPAPPFPASCMAWRPIDVAAAMPALRWTECRVPEPGCEDLVVDWPVSAGHHNYLVARAGHQLSGPGAVLAFIRPVPADPPREWDEAGIYTLEGAPIAAWRTIAFVDRPYSCPMVAVSTDGETVAVGFDDLTTRSEELSYFILRERPERLQAVGEPAVVLRGPELLTTENLPNEMIVDGPSVVVHGSTGSVYLGHVGAGPWGEIGTGRTGDYENANGVFYEGAFYWSARPDTDYRSRIRRRHPGATSNETIMEGAWLGGFRINPTWAFWLEYPDGPPPELLPERMDVHVARTNGSTDPAAWTGEEVVATGRFPNEADASRPILADDLAAYLQSDREWRLLDLAGRQQLSRVSESGVEWWATLVHLGPEHLIIAVQSPTGITTLRRYRHRDMTGWAPLP